MTSAIERAIGMLGSRFRRRIEHPALAPHQNVAATRILALLEQFRGAILADETGMGKSFVAAAVMSSCQYEGKPILLVPAMLLPQWRRLIASFGIDCQLMSHDALLRLSFMPGEGSRSLVVVDEAHSFRNPRTLRYAALARLTIGRPLLLLTATPICNSLLDLHALCALFLADDALRAEGVRSISRCFAQPVPAQIDRVIQRVVIRRGREVLIESLQYGELAREVVRHAPPSNFESLRGLMASLRFPLVGGGGREILRRVLLKRMESSVVAMRDSLRRQLRYYRRARESLAEGRALSRRDFHLLFDETEDGWVQDLLFPEMFLPSSSTFCGPGEIEREIATIENLMSRCGEAEEPKVDALLAALSDSHEGALVFTSAIATARMLRDRISAIRSCAMITSVRTIDRDGRRCSAQEILNDLRNGEVGVVIATDVASEGLDIQAASLVVHYDLPWNPTRIEQRNGRAQRIGQRRTVRTIWFIPGSDQQREIRLVRTISRKRRAIRAFLGDGRSRPVALVANRWLDLAAASGGSVRGGHGPAMIAHDLAAVPDGQEISLLALVEGEPTDDWMFVDKALRRLSERDPAPEQEVVAEIFERWERKSASRKLVPRQGCRRPVLLRRLGDLGLLNQSLLDLLCRRYPAGVESILEEMSDEALDGRKARYIEKLLRMSGGEG